MIGFHECFFFFPTFKNVLILFMFNPLRYRVQFRILCCLMTDDYTQWSGMSAPLMGQTTLLCVLS